MTSDHDLSQDDELEILLAFCRDATINGRDAGIYRLNWIMDGRNDLRDTDLEKRASSLRPGDVDLVREIVIQCLDSAVAAFGHNLTSLATEFPACVMIDNTWVPLNDVFADMFSGQYLSEAPEISIFDTYGHKKLESDLQE